MTKLEQMQERARDLVIKIASRELYDADADHTNIAYYEEQVCNGLDSLITEVWNEAIKECEEDTKRLDFLDECSRKLNEHHGTTYRWKFILNHNVIRLLQGSPHRDIDLNDANAGKDAVDSCREAIDREMRKTLLPRANITSDK